MECNRSVRDSVATRNVGKVQDLKLKLLLRNSVVLILEGPTIGTPPKP